MTNTSMAETHPARERRSRAVTAAVLVAIVGATNATAQTVPNQSMQRARVGTGLGQTELPKGGTFEPRVEAAVQYVANLDLAPDGEPQIDHGGPRAVAGFLRVLFDRIGTGRDRLFADRPGVGGQRLQRRVAPPECQRRVVRGAAVVQPARPGQLPGRRDRSAAGPELRWPRHLRPRQPAGGRHRERQPGAAAQLQRRRVHRTVHLRPHLVPGRGQGPGPGRDWVRVRPGLDRPGRRPEREHRG